MQEGRATTTTVTTTKWTAGRTTTTTDTTTTTTTCSTDTAPCTTAVRRVYATGWAYKGGHKFMATILPNLNGFSFFSPEESLVNLH